MQPDRTALLTRLLRERILVLDGAMGTMIQQRKLSEARLPRRASTTIRTTSRATTTSSSLTQPEVVRAIHDAYLAAGADIIETNTFSATAHRAGRLRHAGAGVRRSTSRPRASRASAPTRGPRARRTSRASSPARSGRPTAPRRSRPTSTIRARATSPSTSWSRPTARRSRACSKAAPTCSWSRPIFDTLNAKAALFAIESYFERGGQRLPVIVSGTITDASGRTLSGQTPEAFWNSVRHAKPLAVGLNCALGAALMRPYIEEIARVADTFVSCYPNAGLPNPMSETGYDETPRADRRACSGEFAKSGFVNIVGGCCGTTPEHIRAIAEAVRSCRRAVPPRRGAVPRRSRPAR